MRYAQVKISFVVSDIASRWALNTCHERLGFAANLISVLDDLNCQAQSLPNQEFLRQCLTMSVEQNPQSLKLCMLEV